jgi:putative membrane protein insertion efficiency factor
MIGLVRFYQIVLSPLKFAILGPASRCRFEPSCSGYAVEALRRHGFWRGSWLAARRLLRCHPWGDFGPDPVPPVVVKQSQAGDAVEQKRGSRVEVGHGAEAARKALREHTPHCC